MLYTAMPLERIYCDMNKEVEEKPKALKSFETDFGTVFAEEVDGEYFIRNFESSYMPDYLNEKYQIGSVYHVD